MKNSWVLFSCEERSGRAGAKRLGSSKRSTPQDHSWIGRHPRRGRIVGRLHAFWLSARGHRRTWRDDVLCVERFLDHANSTHGISRDRNDFVARVLSPPYISHFPYLLCLLASRNTVDYASSGAYSLVGTLDFLLLLTRLRAGDRRTDTEPAHVGLLVSGRRGAILSALARCAFVVVGIR